MKSGVPALSNRAGKLGLGCKANKCSDAGIGDLDVLPTHEPSVMEMIVYGPVAQVSASWTNTSEEGRSPCSILECPVCNAGTPKVQGEYCFSIGGLDT